MIVAIVGNAAEHGGAIVIARAGKMKLASEIAISSSAQVALLVAPVVMLLSLLFTHPLPLTFRWEELAAMAGAVVLAAARWCETAARAAGRAPPAHRRVRAVAVGSSFAGRPLEFRIRLAASLVARAHRGTGAPAPAQAGGRRRRRATI